MLNTRVVTLEKILFPIFCPRRSLKHYFNPIVISFAVKVTDHLSLVAEKNSHKRVDPKMGKLEKRLGGFSRAPLRWPLARGDRVRSAKVASADSQSGTSVTAIWN